METTQQLDTTTSDRTLAEIVRIKALIPIPDADRILLAEVNGWKCVVRKGDFVVGDLGVYVGIDSVVDVGDPNFAFLKGGLVRTLRIRGVVSQGLLGPLSWLSSRGHVRPFAEGEDVTELLGVKKYIPPEELTQYTSTGSTRPFPSNVPKTNESRLQDHPSFLSRILGRPIVITRKEDGCSCTFLTDHGHFLLCGRNYACTGPTPDSAVYYHLLDKLQLQPKLTSLGRNLALQGEIVGVKVNGNRLQLQGYEFRVFNVWDIDCQCYLVWSEVVEICAKVGVRTVPVVYEGMAEGLDLSVEGFLGLAREQRYGDGVLAEGIVVKTDDYLPRVSFKVVSDEYLLKHGI